MRAKHVRRSLFFTLIPGVVIVGCTGAAPEPHRNDTKVSAPAPAGVPFEHHKIIIGTTERQTVLTGFLLEGSMADIAVVTIGGNKERRLRIFSFADGGWALKRDAQLRPGVLFVDVARIGGRDRLISYEPGRLNVFDPGSSAERPLVAAPCNFVPPRRVEIPHVDLTRDVNGDGRDDLVVPESDGFRVFVQKSDGAFAAPVKIGPPAEMGRILGADGYRYDPWSQSRIHQIDYNRDGRRDLAFWNRDHFEVHLQDGRGRFATAARTFKTAVTFDTDRIDTLATGTMTGRVLHSLTDLNGDGVADLVILSLEGKTISKKRSSYEVHFGAPTPDGGTTFAAQAGVRFHSPGRVQLRMDRLAPGRDGEALLLVTTIERKFLRGSPWKTFKGFMGDDIWLGLEFYKGGKGRLSAEPNTTRRVALDGSPSHREPGSVPLDLVLRGERHERRRTEKQWPRAFNRPFLIGDVTGDGRPDLLIETTFRGLDLFAGVPGPELFDRQSQGVAVIVPNDIEYTWLVDLNKDGKQDILMHDPSPSRDIHGGPKLPPGTEPHRVTLLIAE